MVSSSFVEEEHQTWYYLGKTFLFLLFIMELQRRHGNAIPLSETKKKLSISFVVLKYFWEISWIFMFGMHVLMTRLNQTGDKWISIPDIGDWLVMETNRFWNSVFMFIGKSINAK